MTRGIVLTAFLGSVVLAVSACTPPMPPDVKAALAESQITCQSGEVSVAVPGAFAGAATTVGAALSAVCPEQTVTEVAAGQAAPVTFLDHTPAPAEIASATADYCAGDPAIVIPAFAYPVTLAYNIIGLEGLTLTPELVAGILDGSITAWDDPKIVAANGGMDLSNLPPVDLVSVAEPQGAVQAMTAWLAKETPTTWTAGQAGTLSAGRTVPTAADLLAEMTTAEGTVAVMSAYEAVGASLPTASLPTQAPEGQDSVVVTSGDVQLAKVGAGATTMATDATGNITVAPALGGVPVEGSFDAAAAKIVVEEGQPLAGWPVVGYAHAVVCDAQSDPLPLSFAQYLVRQAGQGSLEAFGLTPMPEPFRVATFTPLRVEVSGTAAPTP